MKLLAGVLVWLGAALLAAAQWQRVAAVSSSLSEMTRYLWSPPHELVLELEPDMTLQAGQGLLLASGDSVRRVGEIVSVDGSHAVARIDPRATELLREQTRFLHRDTAGSIWWSLTTLLPEATRTRIRAEYQAFVLQHFAELRALLEPVLVQTIDELATLLKADLDRVLAQHQAEIEHLGVRYRDEVFRQELLPLWRDQIWPIIRRHGAGPAEVIGRELWMHLPLWGLTWRAMYDSVAHDRPVSVERRWIEFVQQEAVPILMSRMDLLLSLAMDVLADIAHDPEIDNAARKILVKLKDDPEFLALAQAIFKDLIRDNPHLHEYLRAKWEDRQVRGVLDRASQRIEVFLHRVGDIILLSEDRTAISPQLARVLRAVVLRKDRAYVTVEPGAGSLLASGTHVKLAHAP
ncbi:MAG: hypothetical protein U1E76_15000 [Planctomycetota bacterium]